VTLEESILPEEARAVCCCSPGSGSGAQPAHRYVARVLNEAKLATLLIDLLTLDEEVVDAARTAAFYIELLAERSSARR